MRDLVTILLDELTAGPTGWAETSNPILAGRLARAAADRKRGTRYVVSWNGRYQGEGESYRVSAPRGQKYAEVIEIVTTQPFGGQRVEPTSSPPVWNPATDIPPANRPGGDPDPEPYVPWLADGWSSRPKRPRRANDGFMRPSPMADYGDPPITVPVVDAATGEPAGEVAQGQDGTLRFTETPVPEKSDSPIRPESRSKDFVTVGTYEVRCHPEEWKPQYVRLRLTSVPRRRVATQAQQDLLLDALNEAATAEHDLPHGAVFSVLNAERFEEAEAGRIL